MQFEFATVPRILFSPGRVNSIGTLAGEFGNRAFIVSGVPKSLSDRLIELLEAQDITCSIEKINQEPTIELIHELVELARRYSPDLIIGFGGGSALDSSKATAALLSNPGELTDYLEVIGLNKPLSYPSLPLIAIPTTSGTGSEVTKNAVLSSPHHHAKVSLRSPYLFPKIALVDPELTFSVHPMITASTGLDALTQLIESYTCNEPNPLTDALCLEGIQRVARSLFQAFDDGSSLRAREDMSIASLFSGLALANARLGAVHGLAGPVGGEIPAAHGAICACLLPHVMEANLTALLDMLPDHPTLDRYHTIGKILSGDPTATADVGLHWIRDFCRYVNIPQLSVSGLSEAQFDKILENARKSSSMKGNPIILSDLDLRSILQKAL